MFIGVEVAVGLQWRQAAAIVQEYRETFCRSGNCFAPTPEGTH